MFTKTKISFASALFAAGVFALMGTAFAWSPANCSDGATDCGTIGNGTFFNNLSTCTISGTANVGGQTCNSGVPSQSEGNMTAIGAESPLPTIDNSDGPLWVGEIYPNNPVALVVSPLDDEGSASIGTASYNYSGCTCGPNDVAGNGCGGHGSGTGGAGVPGTASPGDVVNLNVINSCKPGSGSATWGSGTASVWVTTETWCNTNAYYQAQVADGSLPASNGDRGYFPDPNTPGLCDSIIPAQQCSINSFTASPAIVQQGSSATLNVSVSNPGSGGWTVTDSQNNTIGSGTDTDDTVNTGALNDTETYTLTCGGSMLPITVAVIKPTALTCTPLDQSANTGSNISITVSGGTPPYNWTAGGNPPTANSVSTFTTSYSSSGQHFPTVTDSAGQNVSCEVDVNSPLSKLPGTGVITATPNPCQLTDGASTCTSEISWSTANVASSSVWVTNKANGQMQDMNRQLSCSDPSCGQANWITSQGETFSLYDDSADPNPTAANPGVLLDSVTVTANPSPTLLINGAESGSFHVGDPWQLSLTSSEKDQPFSIFDYKNGALFSSANTASQPDGSWTSGGVFSDPGLVGNWMEYVQFNDGTKSNQINFSISTSSTSFSGTWSCSTDSNGNPQAVCSGGAGSCPSPVPSCLYGCVSSSCSLVPVSGSTVGYSATKAACQASGCGISTTNVVNWACQGGSTNPVCNLDAVQTTDPTTGKTTLTVFNPPQQTNDQFCINQWGSPSPMLCSLVQVSCVPSKIAINGTSTCTEFGNGTAGDPAQPVTWSILSGGGSIDGAGNFTASSNPGNVVVQATSINDPSQFGQATIQVLQPSPAAVTVTCNPTNINGDSTSQCSAKVWDNLGGLDPNQSVIWSVTDPSWFAAQVGHIDSNGLYAPNNFTQNFQPTITATSKEDPTVSGSTQIWVMDPQSAVFGYSAECKNITAPATVNAGQSFSASVTMLNTSVDFSGSGIPWQRAAWPWTYNPIFTVGEDGLASQDPQGNNVWGISNVALPVDTVPPNQSTTFNFTAIAPSTPGTYSFDWMMFDGGTNTYFPQECTKNITVKAIPCSPVTYAPVTSGFSLLQTGSSGNSITVTPGQQFYAFVDYGEQTDAIQAPNINGGSACTFDGAYVGTAARFVCVAPVKPGTYTYQTGTTNNPPPGSNVCTSGPQSLGAVTVFAPPPGQPVCIFSSNPAVVVPPAKSTLSWICSNVTSCTIDHGIGALSNLATGSVQVGPGSNTTYTLTCAGSGPNNFITETATVITSLPNIHEKNP
jgi:hypothetical protein